MRPSNDLDHMWLARKAVDFRQPLPPLALWHREHPMSDHRRTANVASSTSLRRGRSATQIGRTFVLTIEA
jgi:hypothetical protein